MTVESDKDLAGLRNAGRVVRLAIEAMKANLQLGMTTAELDAIGAEVFEHHGARSAPQVVYDFPGVNCISINDEAVHGIPGGRVIEPGDLVKIDVTAELDGYIADAAVTVAQPPGPALHEELRDCAEAAFGRAVAVARAGRDRTFVAADGWTTKTGDGSPSAHYEHTIVVTRGSPIVLTAA